MLKLKHLFDNRDLALMLLENWEYDKNNMDILKFFRISANAIYPYIHNGKTFFLRFIPWDEKTENEMEKELESFVKKDENGNPVGFWGAMSDLSRQFKPWESFSKGLYLAGAEVYNDAEAPEGWTKWTIPAYEFLYVKVKNGINDTFSSMIKYLEENKIKLAGAVNDFMCPKENGQSYMYFPIKRL
jgi:hypothetical protein